MKVKMNGKIKNSSVSKKDSLINFKKSKSLIEKIIKMVQDNEYCIDIMQQNLAVIGLLKSAHQKWAYLLACREHVSL